MLSLPSSSSSSSLPLYATEAVEAMIIDNKRLVDVPVLSNLKQLNYLSILLDWTGYQKRLLDWTGYPFRSLPSSFQLDSFVGLVLSYSRIQQPWKGSRRLLNSAHHIVDIEDNGKDCGSTRKIWNWIFPIANVVIELLSAAFDQLASVHRTGFALAAMIMALIGFLGCTAELAYKGGKEKAEWIWKKGIRGFYCPTDSPPGYRRFGGFDDIFGWVCALLQSITSIVAYSFYSRHSDNPIKASLLPILFAIGQLFSRYLKDRSPKVSVLDHAGHSD